MLTCLLTGLLTHFPACLLAARYERFVQAIRAYEWEVAAALAVSDEEARDVHDSQVRVKALIDATDNGNYQR